MGLIPPLQTHNFLQPIWAQTSIDPSLMIAGRDLLQLEWEVVGGGEGEVTPEGLTVTWRQEDQVLSPVWQDLGPQQEILHPGALTKEFERGNPPGRLSEVCLAPVPTPPRMAGGSLFPRVQGQCCRDGDPPSPFSS